MHRPTRPLSSAPRDTLLELLNTNPRRRDYPARVVRWYQVMIRPLLDRPVR